MLTRRESELLTGMVQCSDSTDAALFEMIQTTLAGGVQATSIPQVYEAITHLLQARRYRLKAERIQTVLNNDTLTQEEQDYLAMKLAEVLEARKRALDGVKI